MRPVLFLLCSSLISPAGSVCMCSHWTRIEYLWDLFGMAAHPYFFTVALLGFQLMRRTWFQRTQRSTYHLEVEMSWENTPAWLNWLSVPAVAIFLICPWSDIYLSVQATSSHAATRGVLRKHHFSKKRSLRAVAFSNQRSVISTLGLDSDLPKIPTPHKNQQEAFGTNNHNGCFFYLLFHFSP